MTELHSLIADLVAINSINPDLVPGAAGEKRIAAYIADWGRAAGLEVHIQAAAPDRPNVILIARGRGGGRSLMLNAHTDTVGVEGMDAPFAPVVRARRLYGRGAYDMKSGLAACMLAVKAASQMSLAGDVMLSAVVDEEYGSIGAEALLADWERWPAEAVLIAEPTELALSIAHRGFVWLEIETVGIAAHGSRPQLGVDAIAKMGKVLVALDAHDRTLRANPSHDLLGSGSLHASIISGGEEISMYPAGCKLLLERRTIPSETAAKRRSRGPSHPGRDRRRPIPTSRRGSEPPSPASPFIHRTDALRSCGGCKRRRRSARLDCRCAAYRQPVGGRIPPSSAEQGIPTVVLGPSGAGAHAREEWVDLASVQQCLAIYTDLIADFCR